MEDLHELLKKPFLNEKETSKLTGRALSTLRNDRHLRRGIPYLKVGARDIRYQSRDILSYMTSCRISFDENLNQ